MTQDNCAPPAEPPAIPQRFAENGEGLTVMLRGLANCRVVTSERLGTTVVIVGATAAKGIRG